MLSCNNWTLHTTSYRIFFSFSGMAVIHGCKKNRPDYAEYKPWMKNYTFLINNNTLLIIGVKKSVLAYSEVTLESSSYKKDLRNLAESHCGPGPLGPPPGLDPLPPGERMSCHIFTRGSLFLQIILWPYATYHLWGKMHGEG